jgi:hypothetical protein
MDFIDRGFSTLYVGIDNDLRVKQNILPVGYFYKDNPYDRIPELREKLDSNIIVFKPLIRFEDREGRTKIHKNIDLMWIESDINWSKDTEYIPVPLVNTDNEKFEQDLLKQESIILNEYSHAMQPPEYIICGDYLYCFGEGWKKDSLKKTLWRYTSPTKIRKVEVRDDDFKDKRIDINENLVFIEKQQLLNLYRKSIDIRTQPTEQKMAISVQKDIGETSQDVETEAKSFELTFLDTLRHQTEIEKLYYDDYDLINFHISAKTSPITILSGMSGTGKTQLATSYAKALGLSEEDNTLLFLPISPSYTEPGDVLGFFNSSTNLYMPSETGLIDFLIHAAENSDTMHMVIFDEMNLSQVEHWFSPFLSLLELKPEERKLRLYSGNSTPHNAYKYPKEIPIGNNILFVGTVNMDETTKDFSDRLLDRANVVSPKKSPFRSVLKSIDVRERENTTYNDDENKALFKLSNVYNSWRNNGNSWKVFTEEELDFFDEVHNLIQEYDPQKGVSFRIVERMGAFLNNIPLDQKGYPIMSHQDAIDLQVKQRILTKIRGPYEQFGELIGTLHRPDGEIENSRLYTLFDSPQAKAISHFKKTKAEILRKARELAINEYAN